MQAIRNGQITASDVIVGFGGFIDEAADEAAERKLAAKAKTIAEARDAGLLGVGLSSNADQCVDWCPRRQSIQTARRWRDSTIVIANTYCTIPPYCSQFGQMSLESFERVGCV